MNLPENILLENNTSLPLEKYLEGKARDFTARHGSAKRVFTSEDVRKMLIVCVEDQEMSDDTESYWYDLCEECCRDLDRTTQLEKDLTNMTEPVKEDTEAPIPEPTEAVEAPLTVEPSPPTNSQDAAIVERACSTRLESGYKELSQVFDFGEDMLSVSEKKGAIPTPEDDGALLGFGLDLGKKGFYLTLEGANRLLVKGKEHCFLQICAKLGYSASTLYNQLRALPYFTPEAKQLLAPTVVVEIATAKYSDDPKKNDEIKKEMVGEAITEGWDCSEARSHVRAKKGSDVNLDPPRKKDYRYLVVQPGCVPLWTNEEPAWSTGVLAFDLKERKYLHDTGKKVEWEAGEVQV